jgi:SsrA-binding protein
MEIKMIASNRRATHEYSIGEVFEAGLVLTGTEVKSARNGKVNLSDGWVTISDAGEAYLQNAHISRYTHGSYMNHHETRPRKLLLKRKELNKLAEKTQEKGLTIVPLKMYFHGQYLKIEIGVAKGKKLHDKRESAKTKEADRDISRAMKHNRR